MSTTDLMSARVREIRDDAHRANSGSDAAVRRVRRHPARRARASQIRVTWL